MLILNAKDKKVLGSKRGKKLLPPTLPPSAVEVEFKRDLLILWREHLLPATIQIKRMISENASPKQIAAFIDTTLNNIKHHLDFEIQGVLDRWRVALDEQTRVKFESGLQKLAGIDLTHVLTQTDVADYLAIHLVETTNLIKSIPEQYFGEIAKAIADNFVGIPQPQNRSLMEQLEVLGHVSTSRARLIARDQTAKLTGAFNQIRQQSIGVEEYIWRTVKDNRVVGKPGGRYPDGSRAHGNHYIMDGKYCKWADATVWSLDKGKTWEKRSPEAPQTHPGQDIQCRCHAQAVVDIEKLANI